MEKGSVKIIAFSDKGVEVSALGGRISTGKGTALEMFALCGDTEKDLKLVKKVLSSGHNTIIEHAYFTLAFNDVSVMTEQAMIEHRLAAYTVKSRRYVDFAGAGYVTPEGLDAEKQRLYRENMDGLFKAYSDLCALGIPAEDARFVLPYCFRSNFIMSLDARELSKLVFDMTRGRLSAYDEIRRLGEMLSRQLDEVFPGVSQAYKDPGRCDISLPEIKQIPDPAPVKGTAEVADAPAQPEKLLDAALSANGRPGMSLKELVRDERPRELELLNYAFRFSAISLAGLTHLTRHRMQTLIVRPVAYALESNTYVLPESVKKDPEALRIYEAAFRANTLAARQFTGDKQAISYFALAGNTLGVLFGMNARELKHYLRLRTCARAQWEIRELSREMLCGLMDEVRPLFRYYGPSCAILGHCPEGRLSCGRPVKTEE